jgi:hypothetical protein
MDDTDMDFDHSDYEVDDGGIIPGQADAQVSIIRFCGYLD